MRIALDATYSLGPDLSGVGVYSQELLHQLAERHPEQEWRWLYRPHRYRAALLETVPQNVSRGLLLERPLWRTPALFHGLNQRLPRRRFSRQIATFHDLFVMTAEYSTSEFRARFTEQARRAALEADHIIAVSHFTARQVIDLLRVEPSKVTVVHHGVRGLPTVEPGIKREKIVLHVGAIQKRKNLVRLVQAFGSLSKDWRLVLAGSDGFGAAEVHQAIRDSPSASRIRVTGYLSLSDLAGWYARAMIFAFPSLDEGFGMPVLEAMSAGVPVIASNTSAVAEVAGDAATLVNPSSEEELREALKLSATSGSLREELTRRGRQRAATFTWCEAADRTFAVYKDLC